MGGISNNKRRKPGKSIIRDRKAYFQCKNKYKDEEAKQDLINLGLKYQKKKRKRAENKMNEAACKEDTSEHAQHESEHQQSDGIFEQVLPRTSFLKDHVLNDLSPVKKS